ncbi:hypothetical protein JAAARDRAFT_250033 [Jaapia argillacea MUCL 33604]|uniref:Uncharacterized protein n=1 Tax=Jaapia argillacea MUCL 33604 TaxID=933084 RepID=A0A067Q5J9_9AGAM|nr:hypothetical protein JAAARDRAFT_250033 [Jaapia argillacea MUCL 33604]
MVVCNSLQRLRWRVSILERDDRSLKTEVEELRVDSMHIHTNIPITSSLPSNMVDQTSSSRNVLLAPLELPAEPSSINTPLRVCPPPPPFNPLSRSVSSDAPKPVSHCERPSGKVSQKPIVHTPVPRIRPRLSKSSAKSSEGASIDVFNDSTSSNRETTPSTTHTPPPSPIRSAFQPLSSKDWSYNTPLPSPPPHSPPPIGFPRFIAEPESPCPRSSKRRVGSGESQLGDDEADVGCMLVPLTCRDKRRKVYK